MIGRMCVNVKKVTTGMLRSGRVATAKAERIQYLAWILIGIRGLRSGRNGGGGGATVYGHGCGRGDPRDVVLSCQLAGRTSMPSMLSGFEQLGMAIPLPIVSDSLCYEGGLGGSGCSMMEKGKIVCSGKF